MIGPYKCKHCGKVLFEADLQIGKIIKICPKCKNKNIFIASKEGDTDGKLQSDLSDTEYFGKGYGL